ncbi:MAG: hypothetical protein IIC84_06915 [Chloroflexi bacterium]|nr:hypothetical protein [Chloroflexota bacterium]
MTSIITFSIMGIIVAFLIGVLSSFPMPDMTVVSLDSQQAVDESFSVEAVNEAAGLFSSSYMSLIDNLITFQTDPDFARAESNREDMTDFSISLIGELQDFEDRLQGELGILTAESDALADELSDETATP